LISNQCTACVESEEYFKPKLSGQLVVSIPSISRVMIDVRKHVLGDTIRERAWRDRGEA
jgi:hypothetical protein